VTKKSELSFVSEAQEISIGSQEYLQNQQSAGGKYLLDPALAAYVSEVGQKLVKVSDRPNLPFEFVVINDSVPNAWALPGGKLAINRGLLTELKSEAELAAVLSHEIVHAAARHGARSVEQGTLLAAGAAIIGALTADKRGADLIEFATQGGAALLSLRYSRDHELEADHYGIDYMVRAGYDPKGRGGTAGNLRPVVGQQVAELAGRPVRHPPALAGTRRRQSHPAPQANRRSCFAARKPYRQKIAGLVKSKPAYLAHDEGRKLLEKQPAQALAKADEAIALEPREGLFHACAAMR
jgi:predicted Zn-dependent protease